MWIFVILHGCSNSGLDRASTDSADSAAPAGLADCPWVGEWELEAVKCGASFDYGNWYDFHNGATMVVAHDPAGGCAVETTIRGDSCRRTEEWHFAVPVGTDVGFASAGITDCKPNKCLFLDEFGTPNDEPECKLGELTIAEATLRIEELNGTMTAMNLIRNTVTLDNCQLDLYTTWKLK